MISHFPKVHYQTKLSLLFKGIKFVLFVKEMQMLYISTPMLKTYLSYCKVARNFKDTNGSLLGFYRMPGGAEQGHFSVWVSRRQLLLPCS